MDQIGKFIPPGLGHNAQTRSVILSQSSGRLSKNVLTTNAEQVLELTDKATRMLEAFPDFSKVTPEVVAAIIEKLASLSPEYQSRMCSITEGLPDKCQYFPTVFDISKLAAEWDSRRPSKPTGYKYLRPDHADQEGTVESRKAFVKRMLREPIFQASETRKAPPLQEKDFHSSSDLKTPASPPSEELLELIRKQDSGEVNYWR